MTTRSATRSTGDEPIRPYVVKMQILLQTDHNTEGSEALEAHVKHVVEHKLAHVHDRLTRVEVHIADENAAKSGQEDKRCTMEARIEHHQPIAVTHHAGSVHQAVDGAADKLARAVDHALDRIRTH